MMPEVLRELFAAAGRRLEDDVSSAMDPYYRVVFGEGRHLDLTGDLPRMVANVEAIEPGGGPAVPQRSSLPPSGSSGRTRKPHHRADLSRARATSREPVRASRALLRARPLCDRRVHGRRALSLGRLCATPSPSRRSTSARGPRPTPAAYVMIPFVEAALGVWYPMGGMHRIAQAMAAARREAGRRRSTSTRRCARSSPSMSGPPVSCSRRDGA